VSEPPAAKRYHVAPWSCNAEHITESAWRLDTAHRRTDASTRLLNEFPTGRVEPLAEYVAVRFEEQHRDCQRVLGLLLDVTRGHPQRSMMLAAHLFARTPAGGAADEATFEDALAGALLDADGERTTAGTRSPSRSGERSLRSPAAKHRSARRPRANTAARLERLESQLAIHAITAT
jgi:hypothetical protein